MPHFLATSKRFDRGYEEPEAQVGDSHFMQSWWDEVSSCWMMDEDFQYDMKKTLRASAHECKRIAKQNLEKLLSEWDPQGRGNEYAEEAIPRSIHRISNNSVSVRRDLGYQEEYSIPKDWREAIPRKDIPDVQDESVMERFLEREMPEEVCVGELSSRNAIEEMRQMPKQYVSEQYVRELANLRELVQRSEQADRAEQDKVILSEQADNRAEQDIESESDEWDPQDARMLVPDDSPSTSIRLHRHFSPIHAPSPDKINCRDRRTPHVPEISLSSMRKREVKESGETRSSIEDHQRPPPEKYHPNQPLPTPEKYHPHPVPLPPPEECRYGEALPPPKCRNDQALPPPENYQHHQFPPPEKCHDHPLSPPAEYSHHPPLCPTHQTEYYSQCQSHQAGAHVPPKRRDSSPTLMTVQRPRTSNKLPIHPAFTPRDESQVASEAYPGPPKMMAEKPQYVHDGSAAHSRTNPKSERSSISHTDWFHPSISSSPTNIIAPPRISWEWESSRIIPRRTIRAEQDESRWRSTQWQTPEYPRRHSPLREYHEKKKQIFATQSPPLVSAA